MDTFNTDANNMHKLAAIDFELSCKLANNNKKVAMELLSIMHNKLPDDLEVIEQYQQEKNYAALVNEAHRIHGGTCYCGVPALKATSVELENAAKSQDSTRIANTYAAFKKEVERFLEEFKQLFT